MEPTNPGLMNELAAAIAAAQVEMQNPTFDKENPHFRSKYASLASVRNAIVPVFAKHGVAVLQSVRTTERGVAAMTTLLHKSGQGISMLEFEVPVTKDDAQGVVSASTYARRISLQTIAVVAAEDDDDGNHAASKPPPRKAPAPPGKPQDSSSVREAWEEEAVANLSSAVTLEALSATWANYKVKSPGMVAAKDKRKAELMAVKPLAVTPLPTQGGTIAPGVASALEEPPARQKGLMGRVPPKVMTLIERSSPWSAPEAEAISRAMLPLLGAEKWAAMVKDNGGDVSMHMLGLGLDGLRETVARMVDVAGGTTK